MDELDIKFLWQKAMSLIFRTFTSKKKTSDREWFIIAATEAHHRLRHTQQKTAQPVQG